MKNNVTTTQYWKEDRCLTNLFIDDELEELFMVGVKEGQPANHHLIKAHAIAPPVDAAAVVVLL